MFPRSHCLTSLWTCTLTNMMLLLTSMQTNRNASLLIPTEESPPPEVKRMGSVKHNFKTMQFVKLIYLLTYSRLNDLELITFILCLLKQSNFLLIEYQIWSIDGLLTLALLVNFANGHSMMAEKINNHYSFSSSAALLTLLLYLPYKLLITHFFL